MERFIGTLKNKIYKYITSIAQNVCIDKLADIVNEHNNIYQSTIKLKPVDLKSSSYIDINREISDKDPAFEVGDYVRISKCKNIFAKGYSPNWSEKVFVIKKVKNDVPWTFVIEKLNGAKYVETPYEE